MIYDAARCLDAAECVRGMPVALETVNEDPTGFPSHEPLLVATARRE